MISHRLDFMIPEVFPNLFDSLTCIHEDHRAKHHHPRTPPSQATSCTDILFTVCAGSESQKHTFLSKHGARHLILEEWRLHCTAAEEGLRRHAPRKKHLIFFQIMQDTAPHRLTGVIGVSSAHLSPAQRDGEENQGNKPCKTHS